MKRMMTLSLGMIAMTSLGCASMKGKPAPDFTLSDLYGQKVTLSEFKGKPVVLCFWAVG